LRPSKPKDGKTTENDRLLGAAVHSYSHESLQSIGDVSQSLLTQLEEFFVSYNKSRGKKFKVKGVHGASRAVKRLERAIEAYQSKK
jgi:inorganic pyrophosphatase